LTFYNIFGTVLVLRMIIRELKMRDMKIINYTLIGILFAFNAFANSTTNLSYLQNYIGDFTDSDNDGMTDVAELRYGFDPNDSNSLPTETYVVSSSMLIEDDAEIGSDNDVVYFKFTNFTSYEIYRTSEFLKKIIPIIRNTLGNPAETFVCEFYNRGGNYGSWMCTEQGRRMLCDNSWNPRLLVHELVHVWKGKYDFASNDYYWRFSEELYGFEEGAEGLAYEILHDYVEAYPSDELSEDIVEGGSWVNWSSKTSTFDLSKHQRFLGGGSFWVDNITTYDRYNASAVLQQILQKHDENFIKKVLASYYDKIEADSEFRPSRDNLIDLYASVVPEVNGIPTRSYIDALPFMNGEQLANEFYAVLVNDSRFRGTSKVFCAFADNNKGEFWWSSPIRKHSVDSFGIPSWFGKHLGSDGYYYTDNRGVNYDVIVSKVTGEHVKTISGTLEAGSYGDGSPSNIALGTSNDLSSSRFDIGLYKQTLQFPQYKQHTSRYTEDYYFFGYKNHYQSADDYSIFVGIDTPYQTDVTLVINNEMHMATAQNNCAVFELNHFPSNFEGMFVVSVTNGETTHNYVRTALNAGTNDGVRHQSFLIIDKNFNGIEDLYETQGEVEAFVGVGTIGIGVDPVATDDNGSATEYVYEDDNASFETTEEEYVYEDVNNEVIEETEEQPLFGVYFNTIEGGIEISWNTSDTSTYYLALDNAGEQLIYGGHSEGKTDLIFADHNLLGTEVLHGKFLEYSNETSEFIDYVGGFELNLANYTSEIPETIQIETENSVVVIDNVVDVAITEDNTTIVNTETNVIIIENTESVYEFDEDNVTYTTDDNVVIIVDDNVTLYTNEEDTYEMNSSDSVVVITTEEIYFEEDNSTYEDTTEEVYEDANTTVYEEDTQEEFYGEDVNGTQEETIVENVTYDYSVAPDAPPVVKSAWETATSVGNNWYYTEWFGYYFKETSSSWIYQVDLGWMYADWTTSFDSFWLYQDTLGWIWTSSAYFPYVYLPHENNWLYVTPEMYYNFATQTWTEFDVVTE